MIKRIGAHLTTKIGSMAIGLGIGSIYGGPLGAGIGLLVGSFIG